MTSTETDRAAIVNSKFLLGKAHEARQRYLRFRSREFQQRLIDRPNDKRVICKLISVAYEQNDYHTAVRVINKALTIEDLACTELLVQLAKCHYRQWFTDRKLANLTIASDSYKRALKDSAYSQRASPVPYFELMSMLLRLGDYQGAFNSISAVISLYPNQIDWMIITQYNMAQILLMLGRLDDAYSHYQELMLYDRHVEIYPDDDNVMYSTTRMLKILVLIETARLLQRQGKSRLASSLFKEIWDHMERYDAALITKHKHESISPGVQNLALVEDCSKIFIDLRFGAMSFAVWLLDPNTYKQLGDVFKKENNLIMAAEMWGLAAEMMSSSGWDAMTSEQVDTALSVVLDRGECLAELCVYEQAEFCAHFAYSVRPYDVVVTGRAARCCRRNISANKQLLAAAARIFESVLRVQSLFKLRVMRRRKLNKILQAKAATKIVSVVRMALVRNRTASRRLARAPILRILKIVHSLRNVWKTGQRAIVDWMELWNLSSRTIQGCVVRWRYRRRAAIFWAGIAALKRIFLGQLVRTRLRKYLFAVQLQLNKRPNSKTRLELQDAAYLHQVYLNLDKIDRFSSGALCVTKLMNDSITAYDDKDTDDWSITNSSINQSTIHEAQMKQRPRHQRLLVHSASSNSFAAFDQSKQQQKQIQNQFLMSSTAGNRAAASLKSPASISSSFSASSKLMRAGSSALSFVSTISNSNISSSTGASDTGSPSIRPAKTFARRALQQAAALEQFLPDHDSAESLCQTADFGYSWYSAPTISLFPAQKSHIKPQKVISSSNQESKDELQSINSKETRCVSSYSCESLQACVADCLNNHTGEDVISMISIKNVHKDATLQWIPFGLLDLTEVVRLLCCTSLNITSPSFSMNDCKKLCRVVRNRIGKCETWSNLRHLMIFGTNMGTSGLKAILELGICHLHSISIGNAGLTHTLVKIIGQQVVTTPSILRQWPSDWPSRKQLCSQQVCLTKLYIDHEAALGDRGVCDVLKLLQYNTTIQILSIRNCQLTGRSAIACGLYISNSRSLTSILLNDNNFSYEDVMLVLRSVANKGCKGRLNSCWLKNQSPNLTLREAVAIYNTGVQQGVRVIADVMSTRSEMLADLTLEVTAGQQCVYDQQLVTTASALQEFKRLGDVTSPNDTSFLKTVHI